MDLINLRSGLSGEKEQQILALIDQSDLISEKERNQCCETIDIKFCA